MKEKKNLKFIVRTEQALTNETMELLKKIIEEFKNGNSEILVFPEALSVIIFNENNEYITMI
jgi:hypothetical protein